MIERRGCGRVEIGDENVNVEELLCGTVDVEEDGADRR